jgi:hypothetical protein
MKKIIIDCFLFALLLIGIFCNKEVSVSPQELPIHTGRIYIMSNPSKAKIYLNDKNTGRLTPDSIRWLEAGKYKITLKLDDWNDIVLNTNIDETKMDSLFIDFTKDPSMCGSLEVKTNPSGAEIFLNSESTGKLTPSTIDNLFPGTYNLLLHRVRYLDDTLQVKIASKKTTSVTRVLVDTAVWNVYNKYNSPLPTNSILSIAIDNYNIKWIGTLGGGLVIFDDKEWKIFNTDNSPLPDNSINVIYIDAHNNKWLGTLNEGLVKFDGTSWTIYNISNSGLPSNKIWAINSDLNDNLWIGTYDKGIAVFDGFNWKVYNENNSELPSNYVTSLAIDKNNNKWIGTFVDGLVKYDGTNWQQYNSNNSWMPDLITALCVDESGDIWAGITYWDNYPGGLYKFDESKGWMLYTSYFSDRLSCIVSDLKNRLWIGTYDNGLGLIEGIFIYRDFYNSTNSPIYSDIVNCIAVEMSGIKWVGTGTDGLMRLKFKRY